MNQVTFTKKIKYLFGVIISLCMIVCTGCNTETGREKPEEQHVDLLKAANELDSLFLIAFNKGDVDGIMNLHWNSPELIAYPPGGAMQIKGYDSVKASYAREFGASQGAKLEYTDAHNEVFKDVVIGHGTFKWSMQAPDGKPMEFNGRYTEVKAMKDGKLVILIDHTSMPMMEPSGN